MRNQSKVFAIINYSVDVLTKGVVLLIDITRDTHLRDLLSLGRAVLDVFSEYNLGCAECLGSDFETLGDAIRSHRLNENEVLDKLNKALNG